MSIQKIQPHELKRELALHGSRVRVQARPGQEALGQAPAAQEDGQGDGELQFDGDRGPRLYRNDGTWEYPKNWKGLSSTMKEVILHQAVRRNKGKKEQYMGFVKQYFSKLEDQQLHADFNEIEKSAEQEYKAELQSVLARMQRKAEAPELTMELALDLQSNLTDHFSSFKFQHELNRITKEYAQNNTRMCAERHQLIATVYSKVLPMYGFERDYQGVVDMREVFSKASWAEEGEVKRQQARINDLLFGDSKEVAALVQEEPEEVEEVKGPAARRQYRYAASEARCAKEQAKEYPVWHTVTYEQLSANYNKKAPGMYYGLEFPFSSAMMKEMGSTWLTNAFRAAETIPQDEKVTAVKNVKDFVKGGAGSKFTFEVTYRSKAASLHTRLFAKIPFPYDGKTRSDRMAMSVNQQGQEMQEISTYRMLESRFPFRIPRYYFGDISNFTTNFILITESVPYGEREGDIQLEPSYHKMKDIQLAGPPEEYYYLLIRTGARLAAIYKKGDLAPLPLMDKVFGSTANRPPELWGMGAHNTGLKDAEFKMKIEMGADFISSIAKVLFPPECTTDQAVNNYKAVLGRLNSYMSEARWWGNRNPDYVAWTHINLNVDNVFFWRDSKNDLDLGVLDWGGVTCDSVGFKLWWWLYCCDFQFLDAHIDGLIQCFVDTYRETCGIELSTEEMKLQFILSAMLQGIGVLGAVPMIYRMCPKKEFKTITERTDPRIYNDIDGTGNLRVYIGTFINVVRIIHDWGIAEVADKWILELSQATGIPLKSHYKP